MFHNVFSVKSHELEISCELGWHKINKIAWRSTVGIFHDYETHGVGLSTPGQLPKYNNIKQQNPQTMELYNHWEEIDLIFREEQESSIIAKMINILDTTL